MSSLAAARADGYYFPPDWDPAKGSSSSKYKGDQGSLGKRAKNIDQGVLVVRFECPYHFWCSGCNQKVGRGVRANAEKTQVGNYLSTKIWSFKFVTRCCANEVEFHTDPKNCEYTLVKGGTRKVEEYDADEAGTEVLPGREDRLKLTEDPFYALEHKGAQEKRAKAQKATLEDLIDDSTYKTTEHYTINKALRRGLRAQKVESAKLDEERRAVGLPEHIRLLPGSEADDAAARAAPLASKGTGQGFEDNLKAKRALIRGSSIFSTAEERTLPRGALLSTGSRPASAPTTAPRPAPTTAPRPAPAHTTSKRPAPAPAPAPAHTATKRRTLSGADISGVFGSSKTYASVVRGAGSSEGAGAAQGGSKINRQLAALVKRRRIENGFK